MANVRWDRTFLFKDGSALKGEGEGVGEEKGRGRGRVK